MIHHIILLILNAPAKRKKEISIVCLCLSCGSRNFTLDRYRKLVNRLGFFTILIENLYPVLRFLSDEFCNWIIVTEMSKKKNT